MRRTQIYLTDEQDERVAALAKARGESKAAVIRQILDNGLDGGSAEADAQLVISSTAGIFDLDDETIDHTTRRQSNPRVSSLGSSSHHGSMAERGSRDLFDVLEEDANPPSASAAPTSDPSSSAAPAPTTRSSRRSDGDSFGKCAPASFAA